jgi:hypothetical protein
VLPVLAALALVAVAAPAQAQSPWLALDPRGGARLEWSAGGIETYSYGDDSFEGSVIASGRVPLGQRTFLVSELPLVRGAYEGGTYVYSPGRGYFFVPAGRTAVGNPYVGLERALAHPRWRVEAGLRLPVAEADQDDALSYGRAQGVEHEDAFLPRVVHLRTALGYDRGARKVHDWAFGARLAPGWEIVTHNPPLVQVFAFPDTVVVAQVHRVSRLRLDYDANLRLQGPNARLALGVVGRWTSSVSPESFDRASLTELTLQLELLHPRVRPTLGARVPFGRHHDYEPNRRVTSAFIGVGIPFGARIAQRP